MDYPEIPGYTILGRLGEGGMATVYLARQEKFNRQVALKVMALHLAPDPSFGERFQREAHIVAQMSHRNFVPVFDVGQHGEFHYMSMEYLPNGNLKSLMAEGLALNDGLHIAREIASGLHYAAGKNFVHRDIKPENILFREDHSAVIADFGIARQMDSDTQMTVIGTVVGTAYYMSPEQARAETIDGRSDLYNLGVIIYEMLTGEVPYDADSALAVSIKHVSEDIPLLPPQLEAFQPFIDRALAKSPEDRFQTGEEMIEALDELEELEFDLIEKISTRVVRRRAATPAPSPQEPTLVDAADSATVLASDSATVLASDSATVLAPQSGMHAKRSSGISSSSATGRRRRLHGRTGQRSRRRTGQHKRSSKSRWALLIIPVLAAAGAGYWFVTHPRTADSPAFVKTLDSLFERGTKPRAAAGGTVSDKSRELNRQALEAIEDDRLYEPAENNAQYFLTTLLALYPGDTQAREGIVRLYRTYLERAEEAIEAGDFERAGKVLNQSSQISYYIESEDDLEQQAALRNQMIVAQQQDIIAREREADISSLLEQAAELLAAGKLTTPPDGNAYDTYQKVLALDPTNARATDGIRDIAGGFLDKARGQAEDGDYTLARASMAAAAQIFPRHPEMEAVRDQVQSLQQESLAASVESPAAAGDEDSAANAGVAAADQVAEQQADIEALLAAAEDDIVAYRLSSPRDNNALQKYREILELDPTSEPALQGIEAVAVRYVQMAQTATADARLDEAARYLEQAGKLSPTNEQYIEAQNALIAAQETASTDSAAESEIDDQVAALLEQAQRDVFDNRLYAPADNNAMLKLRQVLELDPDNEDALQQQAELLQRIFDEANADIQAGNLEQAQLAIDYLAGDNSDDERLGPLREQLAGATVDTTALLHEARMLGGPRGVDSGSYRALAGLYLQVLAVEPGNSEAQEGLDLATRYAVDITSNSIQQGKFAIAESQIGYLEEIDPSHPQLQELRAAIGLDSPQQPEIVRADETVETAGMTGTAGTAGTVVAGEDWTESGTAPVEPAQQGSPDQQLLSSIDGLLQQPHPEAQQSLKDAYQQIAAARALDIANPGVESALEQLASSYAEVIQTLLDNGDQQAAAAYLNDSQSMDLPEGGELGRLRASFQTQTIPQAAEPDTIEDLF